MPLSVLDAQTQSLRHMHHTTWSADDGMTFTPNSGLYQTPDGYLWMGSPRALVRFDGIRFTMLDSTASPLLRIDSTHSVRPVLVDRDGVLWIARSDGALVHYKKGRFTLAVGADPKRGAVRGAEQDRTGRIWFIIGTEVRILEGTQLRRPSFPAFMPDTGLISVVPDTGSGVWVGTMRQGLWHVVGDRVEKVVAPEGRTGNVRPYLQSSDGRLWIWGTEDLMVSRDGKWTTVLSDGINRVAPYTMLESKDGTIWVATQSDGFLRISGEHVEHYSKRHGLADIVVRDVLVDRDDNVWVLTNWALERFRATPFTTLGAADGVTFETPSRVFPDADGGVWVQSMSDDKLFHASGGILSGDTGVVRWRQATFPRDGLHFSIGSAQKSGVLVRSDSDGVQRVQNGSITTLASATQLDAVVTRTSYEDAAGNVWIGFNAAGGKPGFARVTNGKFTSIRLEPPGQRGNVSTIADDGHGHLWVNNTARGAIYQLSGDSVVTRLDSAAGVHAVVTSIEVQGLDTLWMLTNRHSLLRVIGRTVTRVHFTGETDMLSNPWTSLEFDGSSLWIASSGGIARLDVAALHAAADGRGPAPRARMYDAADGLSNGRTAFTATNTVAVGKGGRMWFATAGGLAVYNPRLDRANTSAPRVHIEEIIADGRRISSDSATIPPHPDRVEIHFTAISLGGEKARIEYMLEGADRGWAPAPPDRVASYTQLRAGHYRLRVRAWNEQGDTTAAVAELPFRVVPSWYETKAFVAVAILLGVVVGPLGVFFVLRRRARTREAELHARFDAALNERTRIARELHDTLLQGFSGITLQLHTLAHTIETSPERAAERVGRVLGLADEALVEARHMIWDLRAPQLENQDLSQALAKAARDAIIDSSIELRFNIRGTERRLPPLVEVTALRIGKEAATNAARHAQPSLIEIELAYGESRLDLRVRDDGSGLPVVATNEGRWGIAGMRERAARAGGAFEIDSVVGGGTTISLQLPIV